MKTMWKGAEYATRLASDNHAGWVALELHKVEKEHEVLAARVVFWDAEGQFSLQVRVDEVPLTIVEELIAEAKAQIRVG
jgi:hypothetical protein